MEDWGNWVLSSKTEEKLSKICSQLQSEKFIETSKAWVDLFHYGSPPIYDSSIQSMEIDSNEVQMTELEIIGLMKEALESNEIIPDNKFVGLPYNSITKILVSLAESLSEAEFSSLCKCISLWENNALVDEALRLIVLPKLQEKKEASACTIFSVKELSANKSASFCYSVLIPLITDEAFQFSDVELLSEVFVSLKPAQKDLIVLNLTKKDNFCENDWVLLQSLFKKFPETSIASVMDCICKFSENFTKSQVFGRFLVNFLKSVNSVPDKAILLEVINKHETLSKKQALKFFNYLKN